MRLRDGSYDPNNNDSSNGSNSDPNSDPNLGSNGDLIRDGGGPYDPAGTVNGPGQPGTPRPGDGVLRWRVPKGQVSLKAVGAFAFAVAAVLIGSTLSLVVGGLAALLLIGLVLRDVLVPVRVEADRGGVTVAVGFAGRRRLDWSDVERVRVDERQRLGTRSRLLEIDTGQTLHLFGVSDLAAPVEEVAAELQRLRATALDGTAGTPAPCEPPSP